METICTEVPDLFEGFFEKNPFVDTGFPAFYAFFVGLLWHFAIAHDDDGFANELEEPIIGNPISISCQGKLISQDLANSLRERNTVIEYLNNVAEQPYAVMELGAGYGRLAQVFLSTAKCKYMIFDIPPALYISQWYLKQVFPSHRVFPFRRFEQFSDVADELANSDLAFFTPNQLDLFPDAYSDAFVTISSLHEMTREQIEHYKAAICRTTKDVVYIKQWKDWHNALDDIRLTKDDYILPSPWRTSLDREDCVQDKFQEMIFTRYK
jgi:hypothetical protein